MKLPQKALGRTGLLVSRIGLGTAEIGFAYGIGLRTLPSEKEAVYILKSAVEMGITFFDSASYYGLAEERVGKSGISKIPGVIVATKCAQFLEKGEDPPTKELEKRIREQVEKSLKNLKLEVLPLLLLHGGSKEQIERGEIIEIFGKLKREGKVKHVGISTRGEESPLAAIKSNFFDTLQVAYSILDQRMAKNVLPLARKKHIGVINRSVLLKGSLTPAVKDLPHVLSPLKNNSAKARKIAYEMGISLPALAIRFVLSQPSIATSLIGTNRIEHLGKACEAINTGPLPKKIREKLSLLAIDDPLQVDPSQWPPLS